MLCYRRSVCSSKTANLAEQLHHRPITYRGRHCCVRPVFSSGGRFKRFTSGSGNAVWFRSHCTAILRQKLHAAKQNFKKFACSPLPNIEQGYDNIIARAMQLWAAAIAESRASPIRAVKMCVNLRTRPTLLLTETAVAPTPATDRRPPHCRRTPILRQAASAAAAAAHPPAPACKYTTTN